jgi:2-dehydro-3-deoxygalactonokinase
LNIAHLIALDWGTTNLRASLLGAGGQVLGRRSAAGGVMAVQEARFEPELRALCGDWMHDTGCPLIASGMIGSRQGWVEVPYLNCPATPQDAAAALVTVPLAEGASLHIVPGLCCTGSDGEADVMRGEETQLWGAELSAGQCCVLPGTHSKWAWTGDAASLQSFRTYMTGELYAVLVQHSILGRLMPPPAPPAPPALPAPPAPPAPPIAEQAALQARQALAFDDGVRLGLAEHAHVTHLLFATRTAGLMNRRRPDELGDFLSGLLIGAEIGSACSSGPVQTVTVLAEPELGQRYRRALQLAGLDVHEAVADATTRGQWRLAVAAGLVSVAGSL